jgi:Flp pilus assembly protein protease CpaA
MLEVLLFVVALIGSAVAGFYDLKTTEIPDEIPYAMMAIGIIGNIVQSYLALSYWPFAYSIIVGLGFLGFGFVMYYLGQWGGGDAKILSAIGFLLPVYQSTKLIFPFSVSFFFNVFLVGSFYMIIYAFALSIINKEIWTAFFNDLKANAKMVLIYNSALVAAIILMGLLFARYFEFLPLTKFTMFVVLIALASAGLYVLWKFVKAVENVGFKKKIPVSRLKVGDVPDYYKVWEGITEKELNKIKKSGKKYIWIKEGVRFAPTFPLALLFTLFFGDGILLLMNFFV